MKQLKTILEILNNHQLLIDMYHHTAADNCKTPLEQTVIKQLSFDSRQVKSGTLFFCKGSRFNVQYLSDAKEKGAVAYVSEIIYDIDLPCIAVKSVRTAMPVIADYFYDSPYKKLKMIGITGSKGKSTTVYYIKSILDYYLESQNQKPAGLISGIHVFDGMNDFEAKLTTPEALDVYRYLSNAVLAGLKYMVLEISSQALKYERISKIQFDFVALLNLGRDHIGPDEHPDYEDYIQSKLSLFKYGEKGFYFADMPLHHKVENYTKNLPIKLFSYSLQDVHADYLGKDIYCQDNRCYFKLHHHYYSIPGLGLYNVENALCAVAISEQLQIPQKDIAAGLAHASVPGRDQIMATPHQEIICFISYAHNQLSFEKSFLTIKKNFPDYQIISLFGASGNKGLNRIEDLPKVAGLNSDFIYFIPDDPGYRTHQEIAEEMISFLPVGMSAYKIVNSREKAIKEAFYLAKAENSKSNRKFLLFIAGKGDEHYQFINGKTLNIRSDLEIAQELTAQN